jgi:hypothetical protein
MLPVRFAAFPRLPANLLAFFLLFVFLTQPVFAQEEQGSLIPQPGTPVGIPNFVEPEKSCNWSGIGGQAYDQTGEPLTGLIIKVEGELAGQPVSVYAVTGGSIQFGSGGYLMTLADKPVASNRSLFLEVLDISGKMLAGNFPLSTFDDCAHNLLLVNIREIAVKNPQFFPIVGR